MNKFLADATRDKLILDLLVEDLDEMISRPLINEYEVDVIKAYIDLIEYHMPITEDCEQRVSEYRLQLMTRYNEYLNLYEKV